jgi:prepilin peptidase CpaA
MTVPAPHGVVLILLSAALIFVAGFDARYRRIPNAVVALIAITGFAHSLFGGVRGGMASMIGVGVGVALLFVQFGRGWIGAGDVKLLGALGSWAGAMGTLYIFIGGSVLGGVLALVSLARLSKEARLDVGARLAAFSRDGALAVPGPSGLARMRGIPYGVALAFAAIIVLSLRAGG